MLSSPLKHPSLNSVWVVTELCYENHSWTIFLLQQLFSRGVFKLYGSKGTKALSQWNWWWCISSQPTQFNKHPRLLCLNFFCPKYSRPQGWEKVQKKNPVRESTNIDCREKSRKEIPQEHDKKKFQDISENRNIFVPCQSTPILLRQIHLTCADKANAQLPLVWILYNHMDAFKMH